MAAAVRRGGGSSRKTAWRFPVARRATDAGSLSHAQKVREEAAWVAN